ncbi:MAG TPA: hypothetical protein VKS81_04085 [Bacteroidota bacterium]|nr:hypothetical protein [Bacteroidota bacterium]
MKRILHVSLVFMIHSLSYSQLLTPGSERTPLPGARAIALGDAYSANNSDVSTFYWNPALLSFMDSPGVMVDHYYDAITQVNNEAAALPIGNFAGGSLAIGMEVSHVGYPDPVSPDGPRAISYAVDIGYANEIDEGLSLGLHLHSQYGHSESTSLAVSSLAIGLAYHPSPEITYGLVYAGIGNDLSLTDSGSSSIEAVTRPQRLELGIAMRYPSPIDQRLLTISLSNEKDFGEAGLLYKAGIELLPFRFLALRYGYFLGLNENGPRFGAGLIIHSMRLDYGVATSSEGILFQQVSLAFAM